MKKWLLYLMVIPMFSACEVSQDGPTRIIFMRSFITDYVDGDLELHSYTSRYTPKGCLLFSKIRPDRLYGTPDYGAKGEEAEHFLEIAKKNGDLSYNRNEPANIFGHTCCADNFISIQVKCLNAAWDSKHPAGTSLNDIVTIHYTSYADYVRSGYPKNYDWKNAGGVKVLADLSKDDLMMITTRIDFYFSSIPPAGSYEMEVTFVTTEGEEKTATCTLEIL